MVVQEDRERVQCEPEQILNRTDHQLHVHRHRQVHFLHLNILKKKLPGICVKNSEHFGQLKELSHEIGSGHA
jgi:hypothetical protein